MRNSLCEGMPARLVYVQAERAKRQGISFGEATDMIDPQSEEPFLATSEADGVIQEEFERAEAAEKVSAAEAKEAEDTEGTSK